MELYSLFLRKVVLPCGDCFFGSSVMRHLHHWERVFSLSEEGINRYSQERLYKLLSYSVQNVPYYKEYLKYKSNNPYMWIKSFPIMRKSIINQHLDDLISQPKHRLIPSYTSGSSGERGVVYKSVDDISNTRSLIMLIWGWAGYYIGKPLLQTGMTPQRGLVKSLKDFFLRTHYYVAFGLSEADMEKLLIKQAGKANTHLVGYASSLYLLADVCLRKKIANVRFDKAISLGDKMFPHYRKRIKEAFGCDVIDTYGCSEGLIIAAQKDTPYYYILTPHVYVELLDDTGKEVADGEIGHVVVTSLDAYAMPLIRYDTGDLAIKLPRAQYPEQRDLPLPMLSMIIGRNTDIVKTRSGKYMIVHFFTGIFEYVPEIKQFRVVQKDLDSMEIEYIPSDTFNKTVLKDIEMKIQNYLQEDFEIFWKPVEEIPATSSGKPQIIKSYL